MTIPGGNQDPLTGEARDSTNERTGHLNLSSGAESLKEWPRSSSWRRRLATKISISTQHRKWEGRADTWDGDNDLGMTKVAAMAVEVSDVRPGMQCVDLGCGGGRLALVLARRGAKVIGVDVSELMIERMEAQARREGIETVSGMVAPIEHVTLPTGSIDLVITNYALHHLRDEEKEKVVKAAFEWIRPGGQLVIADMMLGRGSTARDREIILSKVRIMAKKGIPGYWRILKNAGRFLLRVHERPITPEAWSRLLEEAGFREIEITPVVAEAAVVKGMKPGD